MISAEKYKNYKNYKIHMNKEASDQIPSSCFSKIKMCSSPVPNFRYTTTFLEFYALQA